MKYKKIITAQFIKRPNRFLAQVLIDGQKELVHVKNTGRCKELLLPGAKVILEDASNNPNRKTKYSLIAVWKGNILVNMDSQVPNKVVFDALESNQISNLKNLSLVKREKTYKKSRFDIYFEKKDERGFIEVKGVTLEENGLALFPDAPTQRGTKHILEMIEAVKEGYRGIIFFLIQMKAPHGFQPNWKMDRDFSKGLKLAHENGVEILAYDSIVTDYGIEIGGSLPVFLK